MRCKVTEPSAQRHAFGCDEQKLSGSDGSSGTAEPHSCCKGARIARQGRQSGLVGPFALPERSEIAYAVDEGEDLDAIPRDPIDEPEAADEDLADRGVAKLRDDALTLREAIERAGGVARLSEDRCGVVGRIPGDVVGGMI